MICLKCGKLHKNKKFCSLSCANSYNGYNKIVSIETRKKLSNSNKGKGHPQTEETKLKISQKMKEYIKNNNSNWQKWDKSEPCEHLKKILKDMNIFFIDEFKVLEDRGFRIDILLPEYKMGIEVNGNQHYKKGDSLVLNEYYEERHNLIEKKGWKLIELHYKTVYNHNIKDIILDILKNKTYEYNLETKKYIISCINKKIYCKKCNNEIIYGHKCKFCEQIKIESSLLKKDKNIRLNELKKKLHKLKKIKFKLTKKSERYDFCECGNKKLYFSPICDVCSKIKQRKVDRPPYEQLLLEIYELGYVGTSKKYGVSDNAIRKWKKNYEKMFL